MNWNVEDIYKSRMSTQKSGHIVIHDQTKMRQDNYSLSYDAIISFAKNPINRNQTLLLLNIAYGWMPRVARICNTSTLDNLVSTLKELQNGNQLSNKQIKEGKETIGSLVGLSKILHFVAPDKYAIFDKNIVKAFDNNISDYKANSLLGNVEEFIRYNDAMLAFSNNHTIPLRDLEMVLFGYRDLAEGGE